jgi:glycosyltransferase involved in cell wall biosynthesis
LSICDWDALIHHYDNTSRKELWSSHDEMAKLWKDSNYLFHNLVPTDGRLSNFKRKTPTFSIITIVNNKDQYQNFLDDLKKQKFNNIFEVIALPNFNNEYKSASEALNVGKDIAEGEYVIYCHQDIRVPDDWLQKIYRHVSSLNNIGFVGMAGVLYTDDNMPIKKQDAAIYLSNFNSKNEKNSDSYRKIVGSSFEVQCLDELCIIGKRSDPYRFDEVNFNHYHWYGADICLQALNDGRKNYAIDAECFHISDGISNLLNPSHKEHYINGAKLLYNKWLPKSNTFRTTTAVFNKEKKSIKFLVYDMLTIDQKVNFINEINMS